jgi:hypothetical protein
VKWSRRTTRKIAAELTALGIAVSKNTVGRLLKEMDWVWLLYWTLTVKPRVRVLKAMISGISFFVADVRAYILR